MKKRPLFLTLFLFCLAAISAFAQNQIQVSSPNKKIEAKVYVNDDARLVYSVSFQNQPVLLPSALGVTINRIDLGQGVILKSPQFKTQRETYSQRGVHNTALNFFNELLIPVLHKPSQTEYLLRLRVFNDGCAYQYIVPGKKKRRIFGETSSWRFPPECQMWWQSNTKVYEGVYQESELSNMTTGTKLGPPATIKLPKNSGYALISEANLKGYSGMSLILTEPNTLQAQFPWDRKGWMHTGNLETPWRLTIICIDLNGLVNSDLTTNLSPPPP